MNTDAVINAARYRASFSAHGPSSIARAPRDRKALAPAARRVARRTGRLAVTAAACAATLAAYGASIAWALLILRDSSLPWVISQTGQVG